ncbi:MAG: nuclear transport factor 2 family protein [Bryobacteraceae bacterium]
MNRLALIVAATSLVVLAQDKKLDGLKAAEKAWGAATAKADEAALGKILAEDLAYTHSTGDTDTKAVFIANMKTGVRKYHKVDHESIDARVYGNTGVTMCTARIETSSKGAAPAPAHLRFVHVWVLDKGQWKLAVHQSLRLPN